MKGVRSGHRNRVTECGKFPEHVEGFMNRLWPIIYSWQEVSVHISPEQMSDRLSEILTAE